MHRRLGDFAHLFVRDPTALGLVIANLYIAIAALGSDRMLRIVLFSYCAELCIVALFAVLKLVWIKPLAGALLAPLFVVPYALFVSMILVVLFYIADQQARAQLLGMRTDPGDLLVEVARPAVLLVVSHGVSFLENFVGRREHLERELPEQMEESYLRVTWVWLAVLPIGILVAVFEAPSLGVLLVLVKVALDLYYHLEQHGALTAGSDDVGQFLQPRLARWSGPLAVGLATLTVASWGPVVDDTARGVVDAARARRTVPLAQQQCEDGDYFNCTRGCELGYAASCHVLGFMYEQGMGVRKNEKRAAALYDVACGQGHPDACYNLANMIRRDGGAVGSPSRLLTLYEKACAGGRGQACSTLGHAYATGQWGLQRDESRARAHYERACELGDEWVGCPNAAKESLP